MNKIKAYNIVAIVADGKRIELGDGEVLIPNIVNKVVLYGRHYATCPKCCSELGGYFNEIIRKFIYCPYCGERIEFID